MNTMTCCIACVTAGCLLPLCGCDTRDETPATRTTTTDRTTTRTTTPPPADDTTRDTLTAMDQSQSSEHIRMTADIRQAIVADDALSMRAKNCIIITDSDGKVWLQGIVNSQNERDLIERTAERIAGTDNVTSELEVLTG